MELINNAVMQDTPFEFWQFKNNSKSELVINVSSVINFLSYNNIYCYYKNNDIYYIVKEVNNVVEIVSEKAIMKFLQDYVNSLPDYYTYYNNANFNKEAIKDLLKEISVQQFNKIIQNLEIREIDFLKDTKDVCYKYFKNCIIKITRFGIETLDYAKIDKKVWKSNIIDFDITPIEDYDKAMAYEFHKLVTTTKDLEGNLIADTQRFLSLRSALGYLMYNYKRKIDTKAIVLCEEQISDTGGRTGKTLTCNMLEQMGCNLVKINGRNVNFNNRFLFQNVSEDTNIILFDDTDKKFDFYGLYSIITNGLTVEKKNKQAIQFTHQDTPKFIITTNTVLTDESNSGKSRKFEIEFTDFFNDEFTPLERFQCIFFDDWDTNEWNLFYNYMISNIQLFMQSGFISYNRKNLKRRKIAEVIKDDELEDFCNEICIEILTEKKNLTSQEILDRYRKKSSEIANNPKINTQFISRNLNNYISQLNLKAIKNSHFYIDKKQVRGFIYVNRYADSKDVIEFLKDNDIEIDTNDVNSINFDTNGKNETINNTNNITSEGKEDVYNNKEVNNNNSDVNSIKNDTNSIYYSTNDSKNTTNEVSVNVNSNNNEVSDTKNDVSSDINDVNRKMNKDDGDGDDLRKMFYGDGDDGDGDDGNFANAKDDIEAMFYEDIDLPF